MRAKPYGSSMNSPRVSTSETSTPVRDASRRSIAYTSLGENSPATTLSQGQRVAPMNYGTSSRFVEIVIRKWRNLRSEREGRFSASTQRSNGIILHAIRRRNLNGNDGSMEVTRLRGHKEE